MAQLDDISLQIGRLQATVERIEVTQSDLHHAIDKLTTHVNHENELMERRVEALEIENAEWDKAEAERKAHTKGMLRIIGWTGTSIAFVITNVVLFLSGTYEHFFGGH